LKHHIRGVVADIEVVELIPVETKVLFQAADVCIGDVRLVEEFDEDWWVSLMQVKA
jgi:hypothetical protein